MTTRKEGEGVTKHDQKKKTYNNPVKITKNNKTTTKQDHNLEIGNETVKKGVEI